MIDKKIDMINKNINKQNKRINIQNIQIKKLSENLHNDNKENNMLKQKSNNLENNIDSQMKPNKKFLNLNKKIEKMQKEIIDLKCDLNFIQSKEAFKDFIDSCSNVDNKIKRQIIQFVNEIYMKLQNGNISAHSIDLNKPIIEQILKFWEITIIMIKYLKK